MASTSTDSQDSVISVAEQKGIPVQVHPQPVHLPEIQPANQNPSTSTSNPVPEEDNDCVIIVPKTTGKLQTIFMQN